MEYSAWKNAALRNSAGSCYTLSAASSHAVFKVRPAIDGLRGPSTDSIASPSPACDASCITECTAESTPAMSSRRGEQHSQHLWAFLQGAAGVPSSAAALPI